MQRKLRLLPRLTRIQTVAEAVSVHKEVQVFPSKLPLFFAAEDIITNDSQLFSKRKEEELKGFSFGTPMEQPFIIINSRMHLAAQCDQSKLCCLVEEVKMLVVWLKREIFQEAADSCASWG